MVVYGLTGGIATGKSTVSSVFLSHGIPVIDADLVAREVVQPGESAYKKIRSEFGMEYFDDDNGGILIREKLGKLIFNNPEKRLRLNKIIHPAIRWRMFYQFMYHFFTSSKYIILDTPLLFESGYDRILSTTIVVWCDADKELERLMARDGFSEEDAKARLNSQMPIGEKKRRGKIIIENNGSKEELESKINDLIKDLDSSWTPLVFRMVIPVCVLVATHIFAKFLRMI